MPRRKVLLLINTLRIGGWERDVTSICRHIDRSKFEPEVWLLHAGGEFEVPVREAGVKIRHLNRQWARSPGFAIRAAWQISRTDADLIHVFLPAIGFYAALARTLFWLRKPMVLSMGNTNTQPRERPLFYWFKQVFAGVIANSESVKAMLVDMKFDPARISIVPNGHDLQRYQAPFDRLAIRQQFNVAADEKMILYLGRLVDSKRVTDAIAAMPAILSAGHNVKLVIVGQGPEQPALESQVAALGIAERVVFAGPRNEVVDIQRSADLFLFPSETEGLSNSVIEACLAKLPIVACAVPGVIDVVTHDEQALLVPPRRPDLLADAVHKQLANPTRATARAEAAHQHATHSYSIAQFISGYQAVYEQLLNDKC